MDGQMGGEAQGGWASQGKGAGLCQAGLFCRLSAFISICSGHRERCPASHGHVDINTPPPSGSQALRQEEGPDRSSCHPRLLSSLSLLCRCLSGQAGGTRGPWWGGVGEQEAWKPPSMFMWEILLPFLGQCLQNLLKNHLQWTQLWQIKFKSVL